MPKPIHERLIPLILKCHQFTLEEWCQELSPYTRAFRSGDYDALSSLKDSRSTSIQEIINRIISLIDKGQLPALEGFIGTERLMEAEGEFCHEDYIEPHYLIDETISLDAYEKEQNSLEAKSVTGSSVHVLSEFQDSEVLIVCDELPGMTYVLFHDHHEYIFATSIDCLIKIMICLDLMRNPAVFIGILDALNNDDEFAYDNPLRGVIIALNNMENVLASLNHNSPILIERYWDWRD
ncbi:hypothetical protein AB6D11_06290 [Vibrio splendidus]